MKVAEGASFEEALSRYRNDPAVEYAEPNYIYYGSAIPNDGSFGDLWGLHNTGQVIFGRPGVQGADIHAVEAWDITTGSSNVVIAVIDTGIAYNHPDLVSNMWANPDEIPGDGIDNDGNGLIDDIRGWDFVMNDNDPMDPIDINGGSGNPGHGTHVAGIIAAVGNNGIGTTGVMWRGRLMALKAGKVDFSFAVSEVIPAIQYAVGKGARVINASFGGFPCSLALYDSIAAANEAGVMLIAAAGNDRGDNDIRPQFPPSFSVSVLCQNQLKAALPNVIAVAATDPWDTKPGFSNYGATSVQVAAPGQVIFSTVPSSSVNTVILHSFDSNPTTLGYTFDGINNSWNFTSGVSFSTPNSLADSPFGNYANNTNSFAKSPNFSTVNRSGCRFDAQFLVDTQQSLDKVLFQSSGNGGATWIAGSEFSGGSASSTFRLTTLGEVPDGKVNATFRVNFISDGSITSDGVFIDDVHVYCSAVPEANDLDTKSGTSMAAPHVTGVVGLLLSLKPNLTVQQIRSAILNGVDKLPALDGKISTGGRINARKALASIAGATVSVSKTGSGSGSVVSNPSGIICGDTCSFQFSEGASVVLSATPDGGSVFQGWEGGGCMGTGTCTVTSDVTITATFNVVTAGGGGGGGGCTLNPRSAFDPTLIALLFLAVASLFRTGWKALKLRRRQKERMG